MAKQQEQKLNYRYPVYGLMCVYTLAFLYKIVFQDYTNFISLHISNFAITGLIMSLEMFKAVRKGEYSVSRLRSLVVISVVLNIIVELISIKDIQLPLGVTWVDFNTADPIDAVFGIVAALLFFAVLKFCTITEKK